MAKKAKTSKTKSAPKATKKTTQKTATKKAAPKKVASKKVASKNTRAKTAAPKAAAKKVAAPKAEMKRVAGGSKVRVGEMVPTFAIPATSNKEFSLTDYKGKSVVLYFYPKDATPGCTIEGHEFTKLLPEFRKHGAEVFGISRDSVKSHEKFKEKECFTFDLLSDEDESLCGLFGVMKEKNMYGKKVWGVERSTFLIGPDGKLAAEWRGVKAEGHAADVLKKVQEQA